MSRLSALYRLQQIDTELDRRQAKLAEVNAQLANSPAVQRAQAELKTAQDALALARKHSKALDDENKSLSDKIKVEEERLYSGRVKNPRELKDLQTEIETLKQKRESLDEQELSAIESVEGAMKVEAAAQAKLAEVEATRAVEQSGLLTERDHIQTLIANLQEARTSALHLVPAEDQTTYTALRQRKRGIAVVTLNKSVCAGCGESQSSSKVQTVKQETDIVRCSNCERILFAGQEAGYANLEGGGDDMITKW